MAVRRRAAAHDRHGARHRQEAARLRRRARRPRPGGHRVRHRLRARRGARGDDRGRARRAGLPLLEIPYELPFIAVTEQAFTRLVNEQYALLQRSIAAQERLQRIVLTERGLDSIVGALATLVGGTALVFDGRGELQAQRTFRRELDAEVVAELGERAARARAPRRARASSPPPARRSPRARWRCRSAPPDAPPRRPAAGLARRRQGRRRPGRDRPPDPAPGGDGDRARAAAPARRRHDRAPARRRRAVGGDHRRARGRGAEPPARAVRARRAA